MMKDSISKANMDDLQEILNLQYLAYQSEAALFGNKDIPPLKQTLDEVIEEYHKGIILKMVDTDNLIIGSIRAWEMKETVFVGKLMVHPDYRHRGYGTKLLSEIEKSLKRDMSCLRAPVALTTSDCIRRWAIKSLTVGALMIN